MLGVPDDGPPLGPDALVANQLIKSYGAGKCLIASYNDSMKKCLDLLDNRNYTFRSGDKGWQLSFKRPHFRLPEDKPIHCIERGHTYGMDLLVKAVITRDDGEKLQGEIRLGAFPIMLGSDYDTLTALGPDEQLKYGEDPDDPGMYFIVDGKRYAFIRSEGVRINTVVCYAEEKSEKNAEREGPKGAAAAGGKKGQKERKPKPPKQKRKNPRYHRVILFLPSLRNRNKERLL